MNAFELPMGFGMALAKDSEAMARFSSLTKAEQKMVVDGTHAIQSKQEMEQYVQSIPMRLC